MRQLLEIGVSRDSIRSRVALGRLHRVHVGVYAVGHADLSVRGRWLAAVLAVGRDAVLSHRDAAALWGIRTTHRSAIDVTVPTRDGRRRRVGITTHRCRIDPADRTVREGIPATSIPGTLLDLAEVLPPAQLQRAYEQAERQRVLDVVAVRDLLERSNGRRGVAVLHGLLAYDPAAAAAAGSELELRFLDLVRKAGLPPPKVNVLVEGFVVDAYWASARLVVELQGYAFHSDREAFERDHARFARLKLAGFEVLALTWRQVTAEPAWVASAIAALLTGRESGFGRRSSPIPPEVAR